MLERIRSLNIPVAPTGVHRRPGPPVALFRVPLRSTFLHNHAAPVCHATFSCALPAAARSASRCNQLRGAVTQHAILDAACVLTPHDSDVSSFTE